LLLDPRRIEQAANIALAASMLNDGSVSMDRVRHRAAPA